MRCALLSLALIASGCRPADPVLSAAVLGPMPMPLTPHLVGLPARAVDIPGPDGESLQGWLIPCSEPKGSVFLCHGNVGGSFFLWPVAEALHREGYQAFLFDYAGFGRSTGSPSALGLGDEARAAFDAFRALPDVRADRIAVYGVSLGAPVAYRVMAEHPEVKAGIFESLFDPRDALRRLGHPWLARFSRWMLGRQGDLSGPSHGVGDRPALFIVPGGDFLRFPLEKAWLEHPEGKSLWYLDAVHYPATFYRFPEAYQAKLGEFLGEKLGGAPAKLGAVTWRALEEKVEGVLSFGSGGGQAASGRVTGLLPGSLRVLDLPESPEPGVEILRMGVGSSSASLGGSLTVVEVRPVSEQRLEVEAVALRKDAPGGVAGSVRGWCGPGEAPLRLLSFASPDAVACFAVPPGTETPVRFSPFENRGGAVILRASGNPKPPSEIVRTMDLGAPSGDPEAEDGLLVRWLAAPRRPGGFSYLALTRLIRLRGLGGDTFEEAALELARLDPRLRRGVLEHLWFLYPDFRSLFCADPLEAFPSWLATHRAFLHRRWDGRYRLASRPCEKTLTISFGDREHWKEASTWLDGRCLGSLMSPSLEKTLDREGTQLLEVVQGRLRLAQPIPPAAVVRVNLDRLAERDGPWMGVGFAEDPEGVRIPEVVKGSPAEKAGLRAGDLLLSMDSESLKGVDFAGFRRRVLSRAVGDVVKLEVSRKEGTVTLELTLGKRPPPDS